MKKEMKNLENRRDFLRRSAAALGGLGFLMVAGKSSVVNEAKAHEHEDCRGTCTAVCIDNCGLGCKADGHKPAIITPNGCDGTCAATCTASEASANVNGARNACYFSCSGGCDRRCGTSACEGSCQDGCLTGCWNHCKGSGNRD